MGDFKIRIKYNQDNGNDSTKKERIVLLKYLWKVGQIAEKDKRARREEWTREKELAL